MGETVVTWDEARVRDAVAAVVTEAEAALVGCVWPAHALDAVAPFDELGLYYGTAGMIWALRRLGSSLDLDELADAALARCRETPNLEESASLFFDGETALLLLTRSDDERLRELIAGNARNPSWELMLGSPGSILAARAVGLDAEARRAEEILVEEWERHDWGLWDNVLVNREFRMIGPAHGFAGNVHVLRGCVDADALRVRIERVLREYAIWEGDAVNWPPAPDSPPDRIQWCHGAPGIVATLGDLMPEDLLLAGAETTWRNGPLDKGPGLCHGTAGNGYALLKTYVVTGNEIWLERARTFALAALGRLQNRYSLMTGDVGAALFAQACLDVDPRFPIMDVM
ncbi:MAG TPA: LanC-like protein [Gaiellaceae bacterium]|nr:LanC-like protein [Gaiellaceae bacterium]